MKQVTENFKNNIKTFGRQLNFKVQINDTDISEDDINYIKPSFNSKLFQTIMHKLEIDSKNQIPLKSKIKVSAGVKVNEPDYEYISYSTYSVNSCERQEDTNSYVSIAYDKMIESMIDYDLSITEKITLREYLIKICERLGWNTNNIPATFINSDKLVSPILHANIDYTFRDALDEIATISCSFLLFKGEDFYLAYQTETNQNIDEEYLNEDNVTIGEKYFINSLVFSRAEESDSIYRDDATSIELNGLHEYKISDNQLLSTNDRDLYIDDMFAYLKTFEFYIFDVSSKGILFLEACDRFDFVLSGNTYSTILLNNEIAFEDGLSEELYIDKPEETETEYKYADTTDKRINQTYLLVDKQNKKIEGVITDVTEQNNKISQVTQSVDELNSKIQDIADITTFGESMYAKVELDGINESEPIQITVKPTVENISYLYPHENLFPSDDLFLKDRKIRFTNKTDNTYIDYILPDDLLIAPDGTYDEFYLGYDEQICQITKRCQYNADGTVSKLEKEEITSYEYPKIELKDGDHTIELLGYTNAYLSVRMMAQNIYTTQFYTKAETNSEINQAANKVNISVDEKLSNYSTTTEMRSEINATANAINLEVGKKVNNEDFNGANIMLAINNDISSAVIRADKIDIDGKAVHFKTNISVTIGPFTNEDRTKMINYLMGEGTLTQEELERYDINGDGEINSGDTVLIAKAIANGGYYTFSGYYEIDPYSYDKSIRIYDNNQNQFEVILSLAYNYINYLHAGGANINGQLIVENEYGQMFTQSNTGNTRFELYVDGDIRATNQITCDNLIQTSLLEKKKNFERLENGLEIVKNTDIYKYNLKSQEDTDKKHIGFVIGDNYNYSEEITSENNDGVDTYSMISVAYKAIQELAAQNEQLQNEIKELKGEK